MKKALLTFAILFGAGYLLGSMFNGFNTREWSFAPAFFLTVWFLFTVGFSLMVYSDREA